MLHGMGVSGAGEEIGGGGSAPDTAQIYNENGVPAKNTGFNFRESLTNLLNF